jgi:hypothetical protein
MSGNTHTPGVQIDGDEPITDPTSLRAVVGVRTSTERLDHDSDEHCGTGTIGRSVVDVRNSNGEHLLLLNDDLGIALLPDATVDPGGDWVAAAREAAAGKTGISATLDSVLAVRAVDHRRPDEPEPHLRTHRLVFRGSPAGGEIRECKEHSDAGTDDWRAGWFETLPDGVSPAPEGGPRDDLQLVMD